MTQPNKTIAQVLQTAAIEEQDIRCYCLLTMTPGGVVKMHYVANNHDLSYLLKIGDNHLNQMMSLPPPTNPPVQLKPVT